MSQFRTVGKDVACSIFPDHAAEATKLPSGFVTAAPRTNLVALEVLADYAPLGLVVGDRVYVPLEFSNSVWGKRRLTVPGFHLVGKDSVPFILVPADQVCLVAGPLPPKPCCSDGLGSCCSG